MAIKQSDIDAIVNAENAEIANIGQSVKSLATAEQALKDEIQALKDSNPNIDLSGLQAASDQLHTATSSLGTTVADVAGMVPADATSGTATSGTATSGTATGDNASATGSGGVVNSEAAGSSVEPGTDT